MLTLILDFFIFVGSNKRNHHCIAVNYLKVINLMKVSDNDVKGYLISKENKAPKPLEEGISLEPNEIEQLIKVK